MTFQRQGRIYDKAEMVSYHTVDPAVPTVFQSLRDGAVFVRIRDAIQPVEESEISRIAREYRLPELMLRARDSF